MSGCGNVLIFKAALPSMNGELICIVCGTCGGLLVALVWVTPPPMVNSSVLYVVHVGDCWWYWCE